MTATRKEKFIHIGGKDVPVEGIKAISTVGDAHNSVVSYENGSTIDVAAAATAIEEEIEACEAQYSQPTQSL